MTRPPTIAVSLLLIALTAGLAAPAAPATAQTPPRPSRERPYPIPKTLTLRYATLPVWIDATVALTATGEPDPAVWGEGTGRLREILTSPSDNPVYRDGHLVGYLGTPSAPGCRDVGPAFDDYPDPPPRGTLDDALEHSGVAVLGRVTDLAYGFYGGAPGRLFQIEPSRWYGMTLTQPRYYFFVPTGRFRLAGVEICKADQRYAAAPEVGDEVFLFVYGPADTTGVLLDVQNAGDVVPIAPDGSLRLPPQYAAGEPEAARRVAAPRTKRGLLDRLAAVRGKGAQR
jgi:hypothetical protein